MKRKQKITAIVAIAVAMAFVTPVAAFANVGTFGVTSDNENTSDMENMVEISTDSDTIETTTISDISNTIESTVDTEQPVIEPEKPIVIDGEQLSVEPKEIGTDVKKPVTKPGAGIVLGTGITIYVDDDAVPPYDGTSKYPYRYIQQGVDNATAGDTIYVFNGLYKENVALGITLILTGESKDGVIVDGSGGSAVIAVNADGVVISGFSLMNGINYGLRLQSSNSMVTNCAMYDNAKTAGILVWGLDNIIRDCDAYNNYYGMWVHGVEHPYNVLNNTIESCNLYNNSVYGFSIDASGNDIMNCDVYNSGNSGIYMCWAQYNNIINCNVYNQPRIGIVPFSGDCLYNNFADCNVYDNGWEGFYLCGSSNLITNCYFYNNTQAGSLGRGRNGVWFWCCTNNTLKDNRIDKSNGFGIGTAGSADKIINYHHDIDLSNTIDEKPIYYLMEQSHQTYDEDDDFGFLGLISCDNITVKNCEAYNGVLLINTSDVTISDVSSHNGAKGIYLKWGSNCTITDCDGRSISTYSYSKCNVTDCDGGSICVVGSSNNVMNCNARYIKVFGLDSNLRDCIVSGSGISFGVSKGVSMHGTISNCIAYDITSGTGINVGGSDINVINCTAYNVSGEDMGDGFSIGGSGLNIINCSSYNNLRMGIMGYHLEDSTLTNCDLYNNQYGFWFFWGSFGNKVTNCDIRNNQYGAYIWYASSNNVLYHNNFIDNDIHAFTWGVTNTWDDGYPSGGNYWSDYSGVDDYSGPEQNIPGSDGIGDTPYTISAGNQDRYPWMLILDEVPPVITDVKAIPDEQTPGNPVNITCTVTDNLDQIDTVKVHIDGPEGFILEEEMNEGYYYEDVYTTGSYSYYIWANDTSENEAKSATYQFEILPDTTPPVITDVIATPLLQKTGGHVEITATVTDNVALDKVMVDITSPTPPTLRHLMTNIPGTDTYYYDAIYTEIGTYEYTVLAEDTSASGNRATSDPYYFEIIEDTTPPVITDVVAIPDLQTIGESVEITAKVTDNIAVDTVTVDITSPILATKIMTNIPGTDTYYYDAIYTEIGTYEYTISAVDTSGNEATADASLVVLYAIGDSTIEWTTEEKYAGDYSAKLLMRGGWWDSPNNNAEVRIYITGNPKISDIDSWSYYLKTACLGDIWKYKPPVELNIDTDGDGEIDKVLYATDATNPTGDWEEWDQDTGSWWYGAGAPTNWAELKAYVAEHYPGATLLRVDLGYGPLGSTQAIDAYVDDFTLDGVTYALDNIKTPYTFKIADLEKPVSTVASLPQWTNPAPFTVTATASDLSGVASVTLWYHRIGWTEWVSYGTVNAEPWSWEFPGTEGDGLYEFYSVAVDNYANVEDPPSTADASTSLDMTDPDTTHTLDPGTPDGENEWYVSNVKVTLSATDELSGIETTWYKIDSGYLLRYTVPFTVSSDGEHTVQYFSIDNAENREETQSVNFNIDKTAPASTHEFDGFIGEDGWFVTDVKVTLDAADATADVDYTKYNLNGGDWITYADPFDVTEDGEYTLYYYSVDCAGNTETTKDVDFKIDHDVLPPVTTHDFDGIPGDNDWFVSDVTVTLGAADFSPSGIDYTMYKLDEGELIKYTGPFYVTEDANHTLYYYSVDYIGNEEPMNKVELKIDQTLPTIEFAAKDIGLGKWLLIADVSDATSDVAKVEFYLNDKLLGELTETPYTWKVSPKEGDTAQAIVYDNAGNEAVSPSVNTVSQSRSQSSSSSPVPWLFSWLFGLW